MAVAILRYVSDYGAPPAEKEVTLVSGKYTFTSDDLPVISCDGYTFAGWYFEGEYIEPGDVLSADNGETIELNAGWGAAVMPAAETDSSEHTIEERKYLGKAGITHYHERIKTYVDEAFDNVAYINAEDNETVENLDTEMTSVVVDSELSETSVNPVQNKVITQELSKVLEAIADLSTSGGMSATAKNLLITILRNGMYTTDQSANITALETALGESGGGDNTGGVTQTGSVLYITGGVTATQSGTTLIIA